MNKTVLISFTILCLLSTVFIMGLSLNVQTVKASESFTIYIRADGSVDPQDAPMSSIDNITYTLTDNIYDSIVVERDNIVVDGAGYILQFARVPGPIGVALSGRSNVTIKNMEIKTFTYGIILNNSSGNNIFENNITNNLYAGIWLNNSLDNDIFENNITKNMEGIQLESSSSNNIFENNIRNNFYGVLIYGSFNTVSGNNITDSQAGGIWLSGSSNNSIIGNNITANNQHGISLKYSSNNTLARNNITCTTGYGIDIYHSSNNSIYYNNFVDNERHVAISYQDPSSNVWDNGYPYGGNYWSNYEERYPDAKELAGSGIWDTMYYINVHNYDNCPLMGIFTSFNIAGHRVTTICNSTISDFRFDPNENRINFNVKGEQGKSGFCRLTIPRSLMEGPYFVMVDEEIANATELPTTNNTYALIYVKYVHGTHKITIISSKLVYLYYQILDDYTELLKEVQVIANELSNIRNLMYTFIATTIILIATTVYLVIRKPKTKV